MMNIMAAIAKELDARKFFQRDTNNEEKKQIAKEELIKYIKNTSCSYLKDFAFDGKEELEAILCYLDKRVINEKEKEKLFNAYIQYLIMVTDALEGYSVTWWAIDSEEYIQKPVVERNRCGYWDLIAHKKTSLLKISSCILDAIDNKLGFEDLEKTRKLEFNS